MSKTWTGNKIFLTQSVLATPHFIKRAPRAALQTPGGETEASSGENRDPRSEGEFTASVDEASEKEPILSSTLAPGAPLISSFAYVDSLHVAFKETDSNPVPRLRLVEKAHANSTNSSWKTKGDV